MRCQTYSYCTCMPPMASVPAVKVSGDKALQQSVPCAMSLHNFKIHVCTCDFKGHALCARCLRTLQLPTHLIKGELPMGAASTEDKSTTA